jgi:hypothetical protein
MNQILKCFFACMLMFIPIVNSIAQESEWETQKNITGYMAIEGNLFDNLKNYNRDYGVSLTEAGILASYKPTSSLTLKTVFVYRPGYSIDQMLNEVNGEYQFSDLFKIKVGRFLTPLSPMNTYYYAPVNNPATLPMLITTHEFFPLNMDALSINGSYGNDLKIDYNIFGGGFYNSLWLKIGALGLFGTETNYFASDSSNSSSDLNEDLQIGGGSHIGLSYKDYITVGGGFFASDELINSTLNDTTTMTMEVNKYSFGLNLKAKYSTLQLIAEYWQSKLDMGNNGGGAPGGGGAPTDSLSSGTSSGGAGSPGGGGGNDVYKAYFVELSNNFGKITPYIRFEYYSRTINFYRYTLGISYKPTFETTIKLEGLYYKYNSESLKGLVATAIFSF